MDNQKDLKDYLKDMSVNESDFNSFFYFYNNDFAQYNNDVYEDIRSRLTHLKYFLEDSWWNNRFHFLWKYFKNYSQIIDLGFSVPYLPIHLNQKGRISETPELLYVDGNDTSKRLAQKILDGYKIKAEFITGNLENRKTWSDIKELVNIGKVLFTSFETIEHLNEPEKFWSCLKDYVGFDMIISLPIGPKIPSHQSDFKNKEGVVKYISQYLNINDEMVFDGARHGSDYSIYTCIGVIK